MSQILAGYILQELQNNTPIDVRGQVLSDQRQLAAAIATAVARYINTNVLVPAGTPVSTSGTSVAQTGVTTAPARLTGQ